MSWPLLWPTIGGVALALVWQHPAILSVWTALLGVAGLHRVARLWGGRFPGSQDRTRIARGTRTDALLAALRSRYGVTQSLRRTLEGVILGAAATVLTHLSKPPATADERALEEVFLAAFRSRYAVSHSWGPPCAAPPRT